MYIHTYSHTHTHGRVWRTDKKKKKANRANSSRETLTTATEKYIYIYAYRYMYLSYTIRADTRLTESARRLERRRLFFLRYYFRSPIFSLVGTTVHVHTHTHTWGSEGTVQVVQTGADSMRKYCDENDSSCTVFFGHPRNSKLSVLTTCGSVTEALSSPP